MKLRDIYEGGIKVINFFIRREFSTQGHTLTGNLERSLDGKIQGNTLSGYAVSYFKSVNEGIEPDKISKKMFPGLVKYFTLRGAEDPKKAAGATLAKWKNEGMSTIASRRFSKTGQRHGFLQEAFTHPQIDNYFSTAFDLGVNKKFNQTKSETI